MTITVGLWTGGYSPWHTASLLRQTFEEGNPTVAAWLMYDKLVFFCQSTKMKGGLTLQYGPLAKLYRKLIPHIYNTTAPPRDYVKIYFGLKSQGNSRTANS